MKLWNKFDKMPRLTEYFISLIFPFSISSRAKTWAFIKSINFFQENINKNFLIGFPKYNYLIHIIYREEAIHHNVTFNNESGTVSSSPRYTLHWEPDQNQRQETEKLVLPHLAMLVMYTTRIYFSILTTRSLVL